MKTQRSRARVLGVVLLGLSVALVLLGAGVMRRTWRRRLAAPTKI